MDCLSLEDRAPVTILSSSSSPSSSSEAVAVESDALDARRADVGLLSALAGDGDLDLDLDVPKDLVALRRPRPPILCDFVFGGGVSSSSLASSWAVLFFEGDLCRSSGGVG